MRRNTALVLLFCAALAPPAHAGAPPACAAFRWDVGRDRAALAADALPAIENGGALSFGQAARVRLASPDSVHFLLPPERAPRPQSYAAVIELPPAPAPGLYRVSLSEGAWVDAIQNGAAVKVKAFTAAHDCPKIRKSLKFMLSASKTTLQISSVAAKEIAVVVSPD